MFGAQIDTELEGDLKWVIAEHEIRPNEEPDRTTDLVAEKFGEEGISKDETLVALRAVLGALHDARPGKAIDQIELENGADE